MKKALICVALILGSVAAFGAERPNWAYPLSSPVQPPDKDDGKPKLVPGSPLKFTQRQIDDLDSAVDWFPDRHAPMPRPVTHGRGMVPACATCHLTSGMGHPESARLAGLPVAYLEQQLLDFKSGDRRDPARMTAIGRALSSDAAREASVWFAALKPRRWIQVVETRRLPRSYGNAGRMRLPLPGGDTEPLGMRIVELPQDALRAVRRDPYSGFVAYVPIGSLARGKVLVTTGAGKTTPCTTCHGADLKGLNGVPGIAGVSPLYIARQLYDFQSGARDGASAAMMKPIATSLNEQDFIDVSAYMASLLP